MWLYALPKNPTTFGPNVLGSLSYKATDLYSPFTGAFYYTTVGGGSYASDGTGPYIGNFDASRSNATYKDNGKVTPLSLALNYIIKI